MGRYALLPLSLFYSNSATSAITYRTLVTVPTYSRYTTLGSRVEGSVTDTRAGRGEAVRSACHSGINLLESIPTCGILCAQVRSEVLLRTVSTQVQYVL